MFVKTRYFFPSLIFVGNAGALFTTNHFLRNLRMGPGANVIHLFLSVIYGFFVLS
jgi:hypothetical protein